MNKAGSETKNNIKPPLWLLAELTYRCPLQCPYCSNPVEMANYKNEISTEDWVRVMREARKMKSGSNASRTRAWTISRSAFRPAMKN